MFPQATQNPIDHPSPFIELRPDLPHLQLVSNTTFQYRLGIKRDRLQPVYGRCDVPAERGPKRRRTRERQLGWVPKHAHRLESMNVFEFRNWDGIHVAPDRSCSLYFRPLPAFLSPFRARPGGFEYVGLSNVWYYHSEE